MKTKCLRCGRRLKDAESQRAGLGPVCRKVTAFEDMLKRKFDLFPELKGEVE